MKTLQTKHWVLLLVTLIVLAIVAPATAMAQGRGRGQDQKFYKFVNGHDARDGRWDGRGRRTTRSYVIYQRRPRYVYRSYATSYSPTYYGNQYYTYRSTQPYYANRSYRYSQPYFANRYTYSWANPTYRYHESGYWQRHRRSGVRLGIRLR